MLSATLDRILSALALKHDDWTRRDWLEVLLGLALFFGSVVALGDWYRFAHGEVSLLIPIAWSLIPLAALLLAPRKRVLILGALGLCVAYGVKAGLLDRDPRAWYVVGTALVLAVIVLASTPEPRR